MKHTTHNQQGFTLLEALISLAILAFGVMAIITMLDTAFMAGRLSRDYTQCADLAAYMIDEIRYQAVTKNGIAAVDDTKLASFDNDGTSAIVMDTDLSAPANDPGKLAFEQWKTLIGEKLKEGRGIVSIVRNDPNYANNVSVRVTIEWSGIGLRMLDREVNFETVLH